jgi:1-acyl-sn-glycerol-3-phosphate acyltransferase
MTERVTPASPEQVLEVVRRLASELRPNHHAARIDLDTSLERDLGFDSLARLELLARLERELDLTLSSQAIATIETPRDLLRAAQLALPADSRRRPAVSVPETEAIMLPARADTLLAVLDWHARRHADRPHIRLQQEAAEETVITYGALREGAMAVAGGLVARGVLPGETVAIMLPTGRDYFLVFCGALYAGAIPVPIYPPLRAAQLEEHVRRHARILDNARAKILVTVSEARAVARLLAAASGVNAVVTAEELAGAAPVSVARVRAHDIAFLQYTSGSTGQPKGVILTHANLLANLRAMGALVEASAADVFVSWLPLYHDMGLIGAWLGSLYYAMPLVLMSPLDFLAHPQRWLWAIHRYHGTISAAPNFAWELCLKRLDERDIEGLDLSSLRLLLNGAEPVSPATLRAFVERFAKYGLRPEAVTPVYGLAECSLGLAFPPIGRGPRIDRIERDTFMREARAVVATPEDPTALEFVSCGRPLPDHPVRIVDDTGHEVGEREEGRVEFMGPSATSGYFRNPAATRALFHDEWLDSGDRGYFSGGELYVTGRVKDVIIRAGRNIHPQEIEEAAGNLPGVRKGCVAVFGSRDPSNGTERLVVLAETRETEDAERERIRARIVAAVHDLTGSVPDDVALAAPHTVLKTSSGKIRRAASRELYEHGHLAPLRSVPWQFARIAWLAAAPELRRLVRTALVSGYAAYAWLLFALVSPITVLAVIILPPLWRFAALRAIARAFLAAAGLRPRVTGREYLVAGTCVYVTNHASYLDGVVLSALLPGEPRFVAKREFARRLIPRMFLRALGTQFVERFDRQQSADDAARLTLSARAGFSLVFFPEGTFTRRPGLLPFHLGAFQAAAEARIPVVPIALRGTRVALRDGSWFPRRVAIQAIVGPPLAPRGAGFDAALVLRDAARAHILAHCGESDLD